MPPKASAKAAAAAAAPRHEPYEHYTSADLRHELTARRLPLPRTGPRRVASRATLLALLRANDHTRRPRRPASSLSPVVRARRSCRFRLVNVLLSRAFVGRWDAMRPTGGGALNRFWRDVHAAFRQTTRTLELDALLFEDALFQDVRPHVVVAHSASRLVEMWSEMVGLYRSAVARAEAAAAGEGAKKGAGAAGGDRSFVDFCGGRLDLLYLHMAMLLEPKLYAFLLSDAFAVVDTSGRNDVGAVEAQRPSATAAGASGGGASGGAKAASGVAKGGRAQSAAKLLLADNRGTGHVSTSTSRKDTQASAATAAATAAAARPAITCGAEPATATRTAAMTRAAGARPATSATAVAAATATAAATAIVAPPVAPAATATAAAATAAATATAAPAATAAAKITAAATAITTAANAAATVAATAIAATGSAAVVKPAPAAPVVADDGSRSTDATPAVPPTSAAPARPCKIPTQNPEMDEFSTLATLAATGMLAKTTATAAGTASTAGTMSNAKRGSSAAPSLKSSARKKPSSTVGNNRKTGSRGAGARSAREPRPKVLPPKHKQTESRSEASAASMRVQSKAPVGDKHANTTASSLGKRPREEKDTAIVAVSSVSDIVPHSGKQTHSAKMFSTALAGRAVDVVLPPDEWDILEGRLRKVNENIDRCHRGLANVDANASGNYKQSLEADLRFYSAIKQRLQEQLLVVMQSGY
ncbi:unnamed protein product [Hyaloperonospora brassicae]|uniref:Uncharacterized protein n=1 Tax=Hyaloperonospora brassicae TaxID=162125 RepID=A0AAV0UEN1_HYABA|nr:unnamed protein product [Hyaloperonospora brassicae]